MRSTPLDVAGANRRILIDNAGARRAHPTVAGAPRSMSTANVDTDIKAAVHTAVRSACKVGLCIVPPVEDGSKRPQAINGSWQGFKAARPTPEQLRNWYPGRTGLGVIAGPVSGNVECWDFDDTETYEALLEAAEAVGLGDVIKRIETGYCDDTPGGGVRWLLRYPEGLERRHNAKLARRPKRPDEQREPHDTVKVLIELPDFAIVAPTNGRVHPSGGAYRRRSGDFSTIATITADERTALIHLARSFDAMPKAPADRSPNVRSLNGGGRPGDDYNQRTTWSEILEPHGWRSVYSQGETTYWRRPGKDFGISATTNHHGSDLLWVFSSSTAFESETSYSKLGAYAHLEHGGDFKAAAKALVARGYGTPTTAQSSAASGVEGMEAKGKAPDRQSFIQPGVGLLAQQLATAIEQQVGPFAVDPGGQLYRYTAGVWRPDGENAIRRAAAVLLRDRYRIAHGATAVELFRIREPRFSDREYDTQYLNLPNGLLDWRTGMLHPHDSHVASTIRLPVEWRPDATCPAIAAWFDEVLSKGMQEFVEEVVGYLLLNDNPLHKALLLNGSGRNGKGTFLRLLRALVGDENVSSVSPQALDENRFRGAELFGKVANLVGDVDPRTFRATEVFKQITGGDTITAERKHQHPFQFRCRALMVAAFNTLPQTADTSEGFFSRWIVVPFTGYFPAGRADLGMLEKLTTPTELQGLLVRAVAGLQRVMQRQAFALPSAVQEATTQYRQTADPVRSFLVEQVEACPDGFLPRTELYARYRTWSETNGRKPLSAAKFYNQVAAVSPDTLGAPIHEHTRVGQRGFLGVQYA